MYINVTQKSRDLFRDYPTVRQTTRAETAALANPIFSWHATAIPVHRQRFLLLSHDASALCVVLNVTTASDQRLADQVNDQLTAQWGQYGLPAASLATYQAAAGAWEINQPVDHRQVRRLNEQGMYVGFLWDQGITSPLEMALLVAQTPAIGREQPRHQVATIKTDLAAKRFTWRNM